MSLETSRSVVGPGIGYVGRFVDIAFVIPPSDQLVNTFEALVGDLTMNADTDPPVPATMLEHAASIASSDHTFAMVVAVDDDLWAVISGDARIDFGEATLSAEDGDGAIALDSGGGPVLLRGSQETPAETTVGTDLRLGVVPGASLLVIPTQSAPPPPPPMAPPVAEPAPEQPPFEVSAFETADLSSGVAREALPVGVADAPDPADMPVLDTSLEMPVPVEVRGINCSRGHFNNPLASYCQVCGISMVHATHHLVPGIRPTLGFLVFDDGTTYALDRDYLIGRQPETGERPFTALTVDDADGGVSRNHAEVTLHEWDVVISDLGSTNGSYVWDANAHSWQLVASGNMHRLTPGDFVSIGRRTFVFESVLRT